MKSGFLYLALFSVLSVAVLSGSGCSDGGEKVQGNMVFVKGGTFNMGNEFGDLTEEHPDTWSKNEIPVHPVTVKPFWIGKYELTQKEWVDVMGSNPSQVVGDDFPVESVCWYDCLEYCNARSVKEGLQPAYTIDKEHIDLTIDTEYDLKKWTVTWNPEANGYRLPTEAEWEYAARGGQKSKGYQWAGSNDVLEVANCEFMRDSLQLELVGQRKPNELGLYDMSGNVFEWCWDKFDRYPGNTEPDDLVVNPNHRILRSGGWDNIDDHARIANRTGHAASLAIDEFGFRVARNAEE